MPSSTNSNLIELKHITKTYHDGKRLLTVLNDLDLDVQAGEFLTIAGRSGEGKSSLLNILALLDANFQGDYYLAGQLISKLSLNNRQKLRSKLIAYVPQWPTLVAAYSVLDNVALPLYYQGQSKATSQKQALSCLEKVGLLEVAKRKPKELSGGQQQRVAIARALTTNAKLLVADEPTGSLDPLTAQSIFDTLLSLHQSGLTIIVVSHDQELVKLGSRKLYLSAGKLIDHPQKIGTTIN